MFKNHLSTLVVTIAQNNTETPEEHVVNTLCNRIFAVFTNLLCLKFQPSLEFYIKSIERLSFKWQPPTFYSSTLTELYINVEYFIDCLYLLDGCLNQLRTLHINVHLFLNSSSPSSPTRKVGLIERDNHYLKFLIFAG
jgi:hypothetical protein